jgi:uncharacterized protein
MKYLMGNKWWLGVLLCLFVQVSSYAQNSADVPAYINYVNDFANVLSDEQEQALNAKIKAIKDSTVTEIAIVIESNLNGQSEFDRSLAFARAYKVGGEGVNSGVLIYIAIDDRKTFIQTANATQGELTDYISSLIIDRSMKPEFRAGNYYQGLDNAVESIGQTLNGEFDPAKVKKKKKPMANPLIMLVIIIVVLIVLSKFGGGKNGGINRGGGYLLPWMLMGGGGGGGFGGGGSSGGFGGFGGGGGFNGGGAGGSW